MSSSLPSDNETIGNNTINGNDSSSSSSMNLLQRCQPSSVSRFDNEHGDENKNEQKGLTWMPQIVKKGKSLRAETKERQKERKKNGTVNHWHRDNKVLTEDGKIQSMVVAGVNNYATGNGISKIHKAKVDYGLKFGQRVMRAVQGRPKMNAYDPYTQNVSCKNVPFLAMIVEDKDEESSATTASFLLNMTRADWNYTDPREHKNLPIEKGHVFVFSRNDNLFDMNDPSKVARIVRRDPPPLVKGSAGSNWLQKEKEDLFAIVSKHSSLYGKWPEIMADFNKKHPSRGITVPHKLCNRFSKFKKEYEVWLATKKLSSSEKKKSTMAVSASDKKPASKKSAKGANKSVADGTATAMPAEKKRKTNGAPKSAAASTNAADATNGTVLINGKAKAASTASTKADVPKKKRKTDLTASNGTSKKEMPLPRGVTVRPSGKWQAQLYYAGKSRYIGLFECREDACYAYEVAREILSKNKEPKDDEVEKNIGLARKAAFAGVRKN